MTGTGAATGPTELGEVRIELRSVNGRGFALKQRLASEALGLEFALEEAVKGQVRRGNVTLVLERTGAGAGFDQQALRRLLADLRALARDLALPEEFSLRDLLGLYAGSSREAAVSRPLPPRLLALLQAALDDLQRHRAADGAATVAALRAQLAEFELLLQRAVARAPAVAMAYRDKLLRRVNEALAGHAVQLQPADVVREVALFADRADVTEELQRIGAHLAELRAQLAQGGELGRRLEFLLQEILRETNTLGSKSPDVALAHCVVAMKSCIDKLKEQAANLQ